jgi:hypothetical protein
MHTSSSTPTIIDLVEEEDGRGWYSSPAGRKEGGRSEEAGRIIIM